VAPSHPELAKSPTGIQGLDEITHGGLPRGRPTLVCGSAGSGKTLLAASFLLNGVVQYGEPGVLMTFEETGEELASDLASLGYDLGKLTDEGKLVVDYVRVERSEIEESGSSTPSTPSGPSESCWIRSNRCLPAFPIPRFCARSSDACSVG
jgi:circadian clock protein KaiC